MFFRNLLAATLVLLTSIPAASGEAVIASIPSGECTLGLEAAEKIKKHIEDPNPGIEGLSVEYKNGTVFLSGKAASPEAMEKAVLMAGNIKGVSEVNIDGLQAPPVQAKVEYYIIKKGDTLSAVAKQFYGKANDYPRIFEANREVIKDANLIFPGQKIRIPLD